MYLRHFGLSQSPFSATPDTQFFLELNNAGFLFRELIQTVNQSDSFVAVIGEPGIGKSTLYRKLLKALQCHKSRYAVLGLAHPPLNESILYAAIGQALAVQRKPSATFRDRVIKALECLAANDKRVVLLIDEAQAMPEKALGALHSLSEHRYQGRNLLQITLFAQQELNSLLARPRLHFLRERMTATHVLHPIDEEKILQYVNLRLQKCDRQGESLFSEKAITLLARASGGVPRLINLLAHKGMMLAFAEGVDFVDDGHMNAAIKDTVSANHSAKHYSKHSKDSWLNRMKAIVSSSSAT
ncbi:MAG: AAA family ATPase [Gammaproteobacteria bacterium]|nr:AAA family ATPase [Gammaproteobacteria bacterium]